MLHHRILIEKYFIKFLYVPACASWLLLFYFDLVELKNSFVSAHVRTTMLMYVFSRTERMLNANRNWCKLRLRMGWCTYFFIHSGICYFQLSRLWIWIYMMCWIRSILFAVHINMLLHSPSIDRGKVVALPITSLWDVIMRLNWTPFTL